MSNTITNKPIKAALQWNEERYKHFLEAVTDYIYRVKMEASKPIATYHSPACVAVTGYTAEEYAANPQLWYEMIHEADRERVVSQIAKLLVGELVLTLEHRIVHKDKSIRWLKNTLVLHRDEQGQLIEYDGLVVDITARKRDELERERLLSAEHEQRLLAETLGEVFLALTAHISHEAILDEILKQSQRIVSYSAANIMLLDGNVLRIAHWQGGSTNLFTNLRQSLSDFPLDAKVIETQSPLIIPNVHQVAEWVVVEESAWVKSFMAVPIRVRQRALGLLRLDSDKFNNFSREDAERLQPLANAAAIALENARLYGQLQKELTERIEAEAKAIELNRHQLSLQLASATIASSLDLQEVLNTFVHEMVTLLRVEDCIISEWSPAENNLCVIARYSSAGRWPERALSTIYDVAQAPLLQWVLSKRQAQYLTISEPDITPVDLAYLEANGIRTLLVLPMEFQRRIVGLVEVMDRREVEFDTYQVAFAQLLANHSATAIENARLYNQAQREIATRKQTQQALQKSEANLKAILDHSLQAFVLIDQAYKIQAFNRAARIGSQYLVDKPLSEGTSVFEFIPKTMQAEVKDYLDRTRTGLPLRVEKHVRLGKQSVESWNWFEFHFDPVFADNKEIIGICLSAVNINAQKQQVTTLAASEARLLAEMQSVLAITRAMVSEINVNSLLEFIMVQAEHLTDSEGAAVLLLSEDNQWLELATPDEVWRQIKSGLRLLAEGSLAELALASQQVQISNEAVADPRAASIRALLRSVQLNSILCAPLTVKEQNMGVLLVWNKRQQIFSDNDSRLMGLFADQAALAWHNARLHAQNRELAIEQERHRLARELHDSVTQSLYSIGIAAQASHRLLEQNKASDAETALQHIQRLAKTALAEMREKLYELRPTALAERGLVEILAEYCQMLSSQHALKINLEVAAEPTLSMYQQESLYYIIREALWNIVKYANTRQVKVVISSEPEYISLIILDEGLGFDVSILNQGETMGLRNMRERVKLLGGTFDIFSEIGQGTQILVKIPTHLPQTD